MKSNFRELFTAFLLGLVSVGVFAQTTFTDGDIAFSRYNADDDSFSFLFLTDVSASTEFFITDEGWSGSAFYSVESTIKFVVNSAISAGDECHVNSDGFTYSMTSGSSPMTMTSVGANHPNSGGNMLGSFGDNLFAYQSGPNIIAGISGDNGVAGSSGNAWFATAASSTNGSILPAGKTNGSNGFIGLFPNGLNSEVDNARYKTTAAHSGNKAAILADLMDYTKWDFDNTTAYAASTTTFSVTTPCSMTASITSQTNVYCNGDNTGALTVTASNGTANYSYAWSNGATTSNTSSTVNGVSSLSAGTYTVTVTDGNACTATASTSITQPSALVASANVSSIIGCNGDSDGQVTASATGGTSSYTYSWNTGGTSATETYLGAGTYSVTITDANGCYDSASATVTQPSALIAAAIADSNVTCNGLSDGGGTAAATGGTQNYTYSWNTGSTAASITGVPAGTYSVTITDANGCYDSASFSVQQPTALVASAAVSSAINCNSASSGQVTASAAGGTASYTYAWSNGSTSATATNVSAGTYSVTITDQNGCYDSASVTITEPTAIVASASVSSSLYCNGDSDGQVTASATGGNAPYTYSWNTGGTSVTETGLTAGTYSVTVTDQNGCYDSASTTLTEPSALIANAMTDSNVTCNGLSDGGATASATGGNSPYTYSWSNGATTASITGVSAGTYSVTVTDQNGCYDSASSTVTEPALLVSAVYVDSNVTCNGLSDGGATAAATGGNAPYTYSWSNGATTASITGVSAGTYSVTVTDNKGCYDSASATITEPATLIVNSQVTSNVTCSGASDGVVTASATGGNAPYTYTWSNGGTSASITGLATGTYSVTVTDNKGCTSTSNSTVTSSSSLIASANTNANASCNGDSDGQVVASATGGNSPYTYSWNTGGTSATQTSLTAGTYSVTVTDQNGCYDSASTTVTEPALLVASSVVDSNVTCNGLSDGGATASAIGGNAPFTYSWSNGATTASITGVSAGTYSVTVTDQNGCYDSASSTVTEPASLIAASVVDSNVTCNGLSDGGATAAATGGNAPYTYSWSNGATTASITGVSAGTYSVTITDNNGCYDSASATVTEPATLVANSQVTSDVTCNGGSDGAATASATGGNTPYTYSWSNGATTASISGVSAGAYSVTVTDQYGCTSTSSSTVAVSSTLASSVAIDSDVSCNGGSDGEATASATGGNSPYTYSWSDGSTTASITGVTAGTYSVTVTDANGCTVSNSGTVNEPTVLVASSQVDSNATCNGVSDGGATASATGGTTPYTYAWSNSATTASITGVAAGAYSVTVTDANGCTSTSSATVTEPTVLVASSQVDSNATCNGLSDGGATASATGGTSPYTYAWSNAATTASITGVTAGTYSVTITDANGCTSTSSATVTEPTVLVASSQVDSTVTCNGLSDGGVTASATGGTSPYTYAWSNAATTASITGVTAGTYSVTITDANGCTSTSSATVTEPVTLAASASVDSDVSCNGLTDGEVSVTPVGGTSPYTYVWSTSATTASVTGLGAGTYTVTVTDNNGCTASSSTTVTEPTVLVASSQVDSNATCNGLSDGGATASATGGTSPYTYAWSNSATTASITGVAAGAYSVTVTDANGCTSTSSATVTEPTALMASTQVDSTVTCNGLSDGGATASATGGTSPYTYAWSNAATTASITGVAAGTYSVTITDANGCSSTSSATVTEPAVLMASTSVDSDVSCNGLTDGEVSVTPTGGTSPYTYVWSTSATTSSVTGLGAGTYSVTITDDNGCTISASATVNEPAVLVASSQVDSNATCNGLSDGGATASATGGTSPYTYAWSNSAATASITGVAAGTYSVTITDANGCTSTSSATVTEPTVLVASSQVDSNVTCNGLSDGGTTASATGGTTPYTYAWSNTATTASVTGVTAGTYSITITDANGCTSTSSATVTEPTVLVASTQVDSNVTCNGLSDAGATASAAGGTTPYIYVWSNAATTSSITGVTAGTYSVTVTDANGCTQVAVDTVIEPAVLTASATVLANQPCYGDTNGVVVVDAFGGTQPYTYQWSNGDTADNIQSIAAGTYYVTATDSNGCSIVDTAIVTEPAMLEISLDSLMDVNCFGDSTGYAAVSANGGTTPYVFDWSNGSTGMVNSELHEGTYSVVVTDDNNCSSDTSFVVSYLHELPVVDLGNDIDTNISEVTVTLPDTFVTYLWNTGADSNSITVYDIGTYSVVVSDSNGCYNSDSIYISLWPTGIKGVEGKEAGVSIYPNPSHGVFILETFNMDNERVEWMVVNINGQLVKQGVLGSDMDKQSIDLTGNARGVYFLIGKSNSVSFNTRIVVQ